MPTSGLPALDLLLEQLGDPATPIEDRAAIYGLVARLRRVLHRALTGQRDGLILWLEREGLEQFGPLRLKATSVGVAWPCNQPGNWNDADIQAALAELAGQPATSDYVKRIPAHLEMDTTALGADVHAGISAARQLWQEMKARGWRTEEGKALSLEVADVPRPPA
jgi:hypothetical protein